MADTWQSVVLCTIDDQTTPRAILSLKGGVNAVGVARHGEALRLEEVCNGIMGSDFLVAELGSIVYFAVHSPEFFGACIKGSRDMADGEFREG
jgi:hypothetical protein